MKKKLKLPTILGVVILVFGIVAGVTLINSRQVFKIGANVDAVPKNVRVTNITDSSATVTWTTDIKSKGFVKWGKSELSLSKVALEDENEPSLVHSANIIGIDQGSTVSLKINSDSKDYDNQGLAWQATTTNTKVSSTENQIASGTVLNSDGSTPARAIVYLSINGTVISALTSIEGNFVIPISNYIASVSDSTAIEISVQGGTAGTTQAVIYPKSIKFIPAMILGRSYDFRTAVENTTTQLPESTLTVPESVEVSSRFEVTRSTEEKETVSTLSIESIDEGEIITTVDPEFFGSAPQGAQIEIQVESELQIGTVNVDSKGKWAWNPPNDLEAGEHKLTVKWRDASGILRTITRTFIVSASEGPAFESTPSATPLNTTAPTATATAISTSSAAPKTPIATLMPTPETGSLTPTLGLFMVGLGLIFASFFTVKNFNVK
ncbi:MAG: Ig-like domain-containing protein [Microgenomates group bacterium]